MLKIFCGFFSFKNKKKGGKNPLTTHTKKKAFTTLITFGNKKAAVKFSSCHV